MPSVRAMLLWEALVGKGQRVGGCSVCHASLPAVQQRAGHYGLDIVVRHLEGHSNVGSARVKQALLNLLDDLICTPCRSDAGFARWKDFQVNVWRRAAHRCARGDDWVEAPSLADMAALREEEQEVHHNQSHHHRHTQPAQYRGPLIDIDLFPSEGIDLTIDGPSDRNTGHNSPVLISPTSPLQDENYDDTYLPHADLDLEDSNSDRHSEITHVSNTFSQTSTRRDTDTDLTPSTPLTDPVTDHGHDEEQPFTFCVGCQEDISDHVFDAHDPSTPTIKTCGQCRHTLHRDCYDKWCDANDMDPIEHRVLTAPAHEREAVIITCPSCRAWMTTFLRSRKGVAAWDKITHMEAERLVEEAMFIM